MLAAVGGLSLRCRRADATTPRPGRSGAMVGVGEVDVGKVIVPPVWSGGVESPVWAAAYCSARECPGRRRRVVVIVGGVVGAGDGNDDRLGRRGAVLVGDGHVVGDRQGLVLGEEIERRCPGAVG